MSSHESRKESPPPAKKEKKPSLISRLKAKISKVIGLGKKKKASAKTATEKGEHPKAARDAMFPEAAREHAAKERSPRQEGKPREPRREREHRPERTERREGDGNREGSKPQGERSGGERSSSDRRPERGGDRRGGGGGGGAGGRGRGPQRLANEEREVRPTTRFAAEAAPPPPPVPEGPYPEEFEALGLSPAVLASVRDLGYGSPTEIQSKAIPVILEGKDVVGASQTGTGKTAAFGLPTLTRLGAPGGIRCLILEPTRELAAQVVEAFEKLGKHTGIRTLLVHGGVGYGKQREGIEKGVDILVATPGRLLDFMGDGTLSLDTIEVVILDEVDRMLDMGFLPDVQRIVEKTPKSRQTLFFSATMPPQIKSLADWALKDPVSIEIGLRFSPAETVSHYLYPVAGDQREELLLSILKSTHFTSVMIFTRTKVQADKLYANLQSMGEYTCAIMHGDIPQRDREKALKAFREGQCEVIVATDLAARGLDISGVTHVINYCVPDNPEDYVHRIGRTGRAQKEGDAFTLFAADEMKQVEAIETLIKRKIERRKQPDFKYTYTTILEDESHARSVMRTGKSSVRRRR
ncbi:MAG: box helicase [Verrucomicrobiaceae bacterium]|nr:box helicase [Verrucomicrobiaceae bacterium]